MLAVKSMDVRGHFKEWCDKVFSGETLIISRPKNENIVMISETEYNEIDVYKRQALHQSTGRLSRAVRNSDIADSYDAKWLQLSRRAFLPDHSGKWVLFYYNLKKILINYQAEIFKFFYIM